MHNSICFQLKRKSIHIIIFLCLAVLLASSFIKEYQFIFQPDPMKFEIPKGWPKPSKDIFAINKPTKQGFALGKKLFYDGRLSKDGEVSCASCHQQFAAFSNYDHNLSHGVNNSLTTRNAPSLANVAWMNELHWDGAINHIEVQPLAPLTAPNEMGENLDSILLKLKADPEYRKLFKEAFGDEKITGQRMLKAITQFVGMLVSCNSKYDKMKRGEAEFTEYEKNGYNLFRTNCNSCHQEPLFTDNSFRNNGQKLNKQIDIGRMKITQNKKDSLKFKVPTLRNVQLSFPYFHDGSVYSLYKVVDHYRNGIDTSSNIIDTVLKKRIVLSDKEKYELVYFLYTLTDSSFIKNPQFAP